MRDALSAAPLTTATAVLSTATPEHPVRLGAYEVTGLLGKGGMGEVYDARHVDLGVHVALKTLSRVSPGKLRRFKAEFRSVADLSHPNLVPLYELACQDGLWFFTMERVSGVDFLTGVRGPRAAGPVARDGTTWTTVVPEQSEQRPSRKGRAPRGVQPTPPPSIPRVRDLLLQLVRGVHALHEAGLVHADLKPNNVLVDEGGRLVVLDFGLTRPIRGARAGEAAAELPSAHAIRGTPAWMAPEQFVGEAREAADWYAAGLMLYEALTGVSAFAASEAAATWYARAHLAPTPPHELLDGIPEDLSALAVALLRPDPAERPTGAEILELYAMDAETRVRAARQLLPSAFVGRARERAQLRDAFGQALAGRGASVHVTGTSGMGKSALLASFADACRAEGAAVLAGRCYEREAVPYKAFDGVVDDLAAHLLRARDELAHATPPFVADLARIFPVLGAVPSIRDRVELAGPASVGPALELRRRAIDALSGLLEQLAARTPVVVWIEDLQWADADSTAVLARLVDPPIPGVLLAASFRGEEAAASPSLRPYFEHLERARESGTLDAVAIEVGALPRADAEALAGATLRALRVSPEGLAKQIAAESGGVPFFVEELAHYVARRAEADKADGLPPSVQGITLENVLARRVQELPDAERALVEALSVANSPIPVSVWLSVTGVDPGALRALWALRSSHFVRSTGAGADDRIELHHDRMRESVLRTMDREAVVDVHLRLGRALSPPEGEEDESPWLFDAVRHLGAAASRLEGRERLSAARLHLAAGRAARRSAAFPLAFDCFRTGAELLAADAWQTSYDLALALHSGAAEAAYLTGAWEAVDAHVAIVEARGKSALDRLLAREVRIDACIARREYAEALGAGILGLRTLGVDLPASPGEAEIGAAVGAAMESLARIGPEGLLALPVAGDPTVIASMRLMSRVSSAAYFAQPLLLPLIACRLVSTSVERGLSPATPYALSIYGIVLNTLGMFREAHAWGQLALSLLERVPDRSHEARTRHVVNDLVCVFTVPLAGTLPALRAVVDVGRETGDLEFAAYAAHAYVHNAFYAGLPLAPLSEEAAALGAFMRGYEQINALHVHVPFEQAIRCFLGQAPDPARLDGGTFTERAALETARASGSRSAELLVRLQMAIVRYHHGDPREAAAILDEARPYLDGVASTWHIPIFHQYAALAIASLPEAQREAQREQAAQSLAALRAFAQHGAANFAHKVALVEAEQARAAGDHGAARDAFRKAAEGAAAGGFANDEGLAHELHARCLREAGDVAEAQREAQAAREAYARWGAKAPLVQQVEHRA